MNDHYAIIGYPLNHSLSPQLHHAFAVQTGEAIDYQKITADRFDQAVAQIQQRAILGFNVTLPYKEQAFRWADEWDQTAQCAGAANTLIRLQNQRWRAFNTDGIGLWRDLTINKAIQLTGKQILILGAGGAARGILVPLLNAQPARLHIANRSVEKAQQLAEQIGAQYLGTITTSGLQAIESQFDLIINATSCSLTQQVPIISSDCLHAQTIGYDLVYQATTTTFNRWLQQHGITTTFDGWGMLVEQAAEAFFQWRQVRPVTTRLIEQRNMLHSEKN